MSLGFDNKEYTIIIKYSQYPLNMQHTVNEPQQMMQYKFLPNLDMLFSNHTLFMRFCIMFLLIQGFIYFFIPDTNLLHVFFMVIMFIRPRAVVKNNKRYWHAIKSK